MFVDVQLSTVLSSRPWKRLISWRLTEIGSGRNSAAAREALATAIWCTDAIRVVGKKSHSLEVEVRYE